MWKNIWCLIALCILAVKSQEKDAESSVTPTKTDPETKIVEPANISALYIGDLLRTKPKEELEPSDSIHRPVVSDRDFILPSPVAGRVLNYKSHGGHEYIQTEFIKPLLQSRSHIPSALDGTTARNAPRNIMGHLLTLKPVKLVPAHTLPTGRNSGSHYDSPHHSKEDCSKSGDHSYSGEDKSYAPEQSSYRRTKQAAPSSQPEYRSPPSSYSEDDRPIRYYSHSSPSSHDTRSYPSDTRTKSQSSGSYSKSTSKSISKTEAPGKPKPKRIVAETYHSADGDLKNLRPAHDSRGVMIYKTKESPNSHKTSSYTEDTEKDYSPEYDEREHRSGPREGYTPHPSGIRRPRQHDGPSVYSTTEQQPPNDRYTQYKSAPYQQADDSYEQKPYDAPVEHGYRTQNKPSSSPHYQSAYTSQPDIREQPQQQSYSQNYQPSESPAPYSADKPRKSHTKKRHPSHYEKPTTSERENTEYRGREYSAPEYSYPPEHQIQSSRPKDVRPRNNYEAYPPSGSPTGPAPAARSPYDNDNLTLRPSEEKQMNSYVYEATPHQATIKHSERPINRPYRESSRSARSPARHPPSVIVEGRGNLPKEGTEHVALVSKESQPQISHSVSYSESSYNMGEPSGKPKAKQNLKEKEQAQQTEGRQASTDYQTSYKPYNSEYPASYANDQQNHYNPQTYREPHVQPQSYEATPQQYGPHNEEQSYEHDASHDQDHSYDQKEAPVRKGGKNHHYISKIEGFRDTYGPNEHLELDEDFFRKYGISKTAKVIVANAKDANLFVADGSKIKEGEHFQSSGPPQGGNYEPYQSNYKEEDSPNYQSNYKEDDSPAYHSNYKDVSHESPEGLELRDIPGSFDELVDTNPSFLGHLAGSMKPSDPFFKMDGHGDSFDDIEFRNAGEQKGYIVSKNPREIVQQHGDGVSRILFNVPKGDSKAESSDLHKVQHKGQKGEKHSESKVVETSVNPES